tara:strand:- start:9275 stop:10027 length:753 start_codon:yes stop_codon:yes gene_type:complete
MGIGAKILSELSDDAVRWVESLANKLSGKPTDYVRFPTTPEQAAAEMGQKLVNLEKLAPQMKDIYDDRALYYALSEANRGERIMLDQPFQTDLALMKPETFREAAAEINPTNDPYIRDMVAEKVENLRDLRRSGIRFSDVPFLGYKEPYPDIMQVIAHEGRHRSRALAGEGEPLQLVRMNPYKDPYGEATATPVRQMSPETQVMSEVSTMQQEGGGKSVGALGQIMKILGLGGVAAPGVLSQVEAQQDGS